MNIKNYIGTCLALVSIGWMAPATQAPANDSKLTIKIEPGYDLDEEYIKKDDEYVRKLPLSGKVKTINGNIITMTGKTYLRKTDDSSGKTTAVNDSTYTINATNATIIKNNATTTLSNVFIGDVIIVQEGTLTGTNIVATLIYDGMIPNKKDSERFTPKPTFVKNIKNFITRLFGFKTD